MKESDLIAGAVDTASGKMVTQDTSQDRTQFWKKWPLANDGKLAIPG